VQILDGLATRKLAETSTPLALDYPDTRYRLKLAENMVEKLLRDPDRQCRTIDGMKSFLDDHAKEIG
jgi:hypothetical protein